MTLITEDVPHDWVTLHRMRFPAVVSAKERSFPPVEGASVWRFGPLHTLGADGLPTLTSDIWCGMAIWPNRAEAEAMLDNPGAAMPWLSEAVAGGFYAEHKGRPVYPALIEFMTSGPVMVQVLEGENAVAKNRELMGATNPKEAAAGTIRADFAETIDANAVHGSDSPASAAREIAYFFAESEICARD